MWGTKHDDDDGLDCLIMCMECEHSWHGTAPEVWDGEHDDTEQPRRKDAGTAAARILGWARKHDAA